MYSTTIVCMDHDIKAPWAMIGTERLHRTLSQPELVTEWMILDDILILSGMWIISIQSIGSVMYLMHSRHVTARTMQLYSAPGSVLLDST